MRGQWTDLPAHDRVGSPEPALPSPELCEIGREGHCKPYGRLNVRIGDDDELGSFVFRTTGCQQHPDPRRSAALLHAVSGGLLSAMPLELRLRGKSTTLSRRAPIYYVDLTVRSGMTLGEAISFAKGSCTGSASSAVSTRRGLDDAARACLSEGGLEETGKKWGPC